MTDDEEQRRLELMRRVRREVQAEARAGTPRACAACGWPIVAREPVAITVSGEGVVRVEHKHIEGVARCRR